MQVPTRPPSPASTIYESDEEINTASGDDARRKNSLTTVYGSGDSFQKLPSRTIVLCLEGSDKRFGVDYAKDFMLLLDKSNIARQKVYCNHQIPRWEPHSYVLKFTLLNPKEIL